MIHTYRHATLTIFLFLSGYILQAQTENDSTLTTPVVKEKKGSIFSGRPGKALLMSLILPGTGQIYNKSYLRVPFVYAAVGGTGAVLIINTRQYKCLKMAYIARVDGQIGQIPDLPPCRDRDAIASITDPAKLRILRDNANQYRQQSILIFSLVWLANGIDAFVNAHLKEFDIDDDLSIELGPRMDDDPYVPTRMGLFVSF